MYFRNADECYEESSPPCWAYYYGCERLGNFGHQSIVVSLIFSTCPCRTVFRMEFLLYFGEFSTSQLVRTISTLNITSSVQDVPQILINVGYILLRETEKSQERATYLNWQVGEDGSKTVVKVPQSSSTISTIFQVDFNDKSRRCPTGEFVGYIVDEKRKEIMSNIILFTSSFFVESVDGRRWIMRRAPLRSSRHHWTLSAKMYWTSINSRSWIEPVPPMRDAVIQRKMSEIILTGLPLFIRSALNSGRLSWGQTPRPLAGKALQRCGTIDILSSKFAHACISQRVIVLLLLFKDIQITLFIL